MRLGRLGRAPSMNFDRPSSLGVRGLEPAPYPDTGVRVIVASQSEKKPILGAQASGECRGENYDRYVLRSLLITAHRPAANPAAPMIIRISNELARGTYPPVKGKPSRAQNGKPIKCKS